MNTLRTCVWFDHGQALEAANFYASTFPNSSVVQINYAPSDFHGGKLLITDLLRNSLPGPS